jgi:uncharacterized membrane protein YdbT with pleckstrin-like domain
MALKNKYFESQEEGEEVLIVTRRHWIVYISPMILGFFAILISLAILNGFFPDLLATYSLKVFTFSAFTLLLLFTSLFVYANWLINYLNVQIVTTKHVVDIDQISLFNRKVSELSLDEIQDVSASQMGILQSFLGYGNVKIQTAGELPNFEFEKIPKPYIVSRRIMEIKDQYWENLKKERKSKTTE